MGTTEPRNEEQIPNVNVPSSPDMAQQGAVSPDLGGIHSQVKEQTGTVIHSADGDLGKEQTVRDALREAIDGCRGPEKRFLQVLTDPNASIQDIRSASIDPQKARELAATIAKDEARHRRKDARLSQALERAPRETEQAAQNAVQASIHAEASSDRGDMVGGVGGGLAGGLIGGFLEKLMKYLSKGATFLVLGGKEAWNSHKRREELKNLKHAEKVKKLLSN